MTTCFSLGAVRSSRYWLRRRDDRVRAVSRCAERLEESAHVSEPDGKARMSTFGRVTSPLFSGSQMCSRSVSAMSMHGKASRCYVLTLAA
jgi:hypothetical protein